MEGYIGLRVRRTGCTLVSVAAPGEPVRRQQIELNGRALVQTVCRIPGRRHLVLEEGGCSEWLREILDPYVDEIAIVRARSGSAGESDEQVALQLAEQCRSGELTRLVLCDENSLGRLRDIVRAQGLVRQDLLRVRQRLRSLSFDGPRMRSRGWIRRPRDRESLSRRRPAVSRQRIRCLHEQLDFLLSQKRRYEAQVIREAARHPIVLVLETAPGFTRVAAAQLLALVVAPARFRSKRQFWSYCGLGVEPTGESKSSPSGPRCSGRWHGEGAGPARERFNPELKRLFLGAAAALVRQPGSDPLGVRHRGRIEAGMRPTLASLTLARSIAAVVLRMWKEESPYDPSRLQASGRGGVAGGRRGVSFERRPGGAPRKPSSTPFRR